MTPQSRLERAQTSNLQFRSQLARHCKENDIPYDINFSSEVLSKEAGVDSSLFYTAMRGLYQFKPKGLKETGANVIIAMESKQQNNHGEVVATIADATAAHILGLANIMPASGKMDEARTTIHIRRSINPAYRAAFEQEGSEEVKKLIEDNGAAVIVTSIGWEDSLLMMDIPHGEEQLDHLWNVHAFVVDSTGNNGMYGPKGDQESVGQKHNGVTHGSALALRIGAAAWDEAKGGWMVQGYSSANGPTACGVVYPEVKLNWNNIGEDGQPLSPEPAIGTSSANPWYGGVLDALNSEFGKYLTREQMLYSLLSTSDKPLGVKALPPKTPEAQEIAFITNAAGHMFDPIWSGHGVPNLEKAEKLCAHMVEYAQEHPEQITIAKETTVRLEERKDKQVPNDEGKYTYKMRMDEGIAMKSTFGFLFEGERGDVSITSPAGTKVPLHLTVGTNKNEENPINRFSISTTEALMGEDMEGFITIESTTPLDSVKVRSHSMQVGDLVKDVTYDKIKDDPMPNLKNAKTLDELIGIDKNWEDRVRTRKNVKGLKINGIRPDIEDTDEIIEMLRKAPDGIADNARTRTHTMLSYPYHGEGGAHENKAYAALKEYEKVRGEAASSRATRWDMTDLITAAKEYELAGKAYEAAGESMAAANTYSLSGQNWRKILINQPVEGMFPSEHAARVFEAALPHHLAQEHHDFEYRDRNQFFGAVADTLQAYKILAKRDPENATAHNARVEEYARVLEEQPALLANASRRIQGALEPAAMRVEEREIGFSHTCPIGTDNVSQCLTIAVQQKPPKGRPHDKTVALAHIDVETDLESLDALFERMPAGEKRVRVFGARFDKDHRSSKNIVNILQKLAEWDVDIISADVYGGDAGPSAAVIDPEDFSIKEAVPALENPNYAISYGHILLTGKDPTEPLLIAFDMRNGDFRAPIAFGQKEVETLHRHYLEKEDSSNSNYVAKNIPDQQSAMKKQGLYDHGLCVEHIGGVLKGYETARVVEKKILRQLAPEITVEETTAEGEKYQAPLKNVESVFRAIEKLPVYVGENAGPLNELLIHRIVNSLEVREGKVEVKKGEGRLLEEQGYAVLEDLFGLGKGHVDKLKKQDATDTGTAGGSAGGDL
jgi:hypothetical protein